MSFRASPAIVAALKGFEPSAEQWAAITHPLEPVHLVAGAGAGKTAVMAARIVWAIETQGLSPSQVLGLTFTNKAAQELEERVRHALEALEDVRPEEVTVQTYNAFAASIVREHGLLIGVEADAGLLSDAQQWQLANRCADDLGALEWIDLRSVGGLVRATLDLASSIADHVVTTDQVIAADESLRASEGASDDVIKTASKRIELCRAVDLYNEAKRNLGRIDFGDQITKAVQVLVRYPEVCRSYRERFPFVLLDEYQDTNIAQRRLMKALVAPGGSVTAVGDTRQAIYAFRGATMYNLIDFPRTFPRSTGSDYEPISLSENFRSGARILEVANHIVDKIPEERRPGAPLRPLPANGRGRVELALLADERTEAAWIAARIEALHGQVLGEGRAPVAWRDVAVLVRRRAAMDALLEALEERDIPVEVVGLSGLLKTPEVTEVVAWLRCLDTKPSANRWVARILLGPRWRIHYRDLALCARWAAGRTWDLKVKLAAGDPERARDMEPGDVGFALVEAIDHLGEVADLPSEARRRLEDFRARLEALRERAHAPLLELAQEAIRVSGIGDALLGSPTRAAGAARQNLSNFLDHVAAFAPVEGEATLRSFLAYLDAAEEAEETLEASQPAESDSVKLMTVHSAKGLEFECVFVPSVAASKNNKGEHVHSIFPSTRTSNPLESYRTLPFEVREDRAHYPKFERNLKKFKEEVIARTIEDERRLFYVALTRAKQFLAVSAAHWYGRDQRAKGPSQFFEELAELAGGPVEYVRHDEPPETNPIIELLESRSTWPPQARLGDGDDLFEQGWGQVAEDVVAGRVALEDLVASLDAEGRAVYEARTAEIAAELELLERARAGRVPTEARPPRIVSATELAKMASSPDGLTRLLRPLPERPSPERALGTEIHRLIEERSLELDEEAWLLPFAEEAELDEPAPIGEDIAERLARWRELGFADRRLARLPSGAPMVEVPFAMRRGDLIVKGRIDAVFETDDGGIEIVDYKTGKRFEASDGDQLSIYAEALEAMGLLPEGAPVYLTYAFLDGDEPFTRPWRA